MEDFRDIRRRNLDTLLGIVTNGIFTIGGDMRISTMNEAAERILGIERGGALGRTCRDVLGPHMCSETCAFRSTMEDRRSRKDWMVRVIRPDGRPRDLVLSTAYLSAPGGEAPEVAVSLREVTEAERLRRALRDRWTFHGLVAASMEMKELFSLIREMAPYDSTVLILGESGTGKELAAKALHAESGRRDRPFVTVNCSAYPETLLESELFGHVAGAFTGATRDRRGRFEAADGGTVFLDEIGDVSPTIQVKLLRVLQERHVERVGAQTPIPVDIRIVAATHRDLKEEVGTGGFREDLFYRLNVITLRMPALRSRRADIPALAEHFMARFAEKTRKRVTSLSEGALEALFRHDWPGNVRELENAMEHALVRARGPVVMARDLPADVLGGGGAFDSMGDLDGRIDAALRASDGKIGRAAGLLGIHRTTLWRRLRARAASKEKDSR